MITGMNLLFPNKMHSSTRYTQGESNPDTTLLLSKVGTSRRMLYRPDLNNRHLAIDMAVGLSSCILRGETHMQIQATAIPVPLIGTISGLGPCACLVGHQNLVASTHRPSSLLGFGDNVGD